MNLILNRHRSVLSFRQAMHELTDGASSLSFAVSYLQLGGWHLLRQSITNIVPTQVRLVCTDQFGITHPSAVRQALTHQVQVRRYSGSGTYHPKVYLSYDRQQRPRSFLVSSANLSHAAFTNSVEAGIYGRDRTVLTELDGWFRHLFSRDSEALAEADLVEMEAQWRLTAAARVKNQLERRRRPSPQPAPGVTLVSVADLDAIEDVFATIQLPIGLLNFDHARNNIRNLGHLLTVLEASRAGGRNVLPTSSKQRSELRLLGLISTDSYSDVGQHALNARTPDALARMWCDWIQHVNDAVLLQINERLVAFKRVMQQFWKLRSEVREFFLNNVNNRAEKHTLQTIELLCNASDVVQELSMDHFRALTPLLDQVDRLPVHVRDAINEYRTNKGTRGWELPDRKIMPRAWRAAETAGAH